MAELKYTEVGKVKSIRGCIVIVVGFNNCINGQLVEFGFGTFGTILGFDKKEAQILIIKEVTPIRTGDEVHASLEPFNVPVGDNFLGRIVNPLCDPCDSLGPITPDAHYPIFPTAPAILERRVLHRALETGTKVVDAMIPVGLGQRELILGNKMTGKTTLITDTVINQKGKDVICIYCAIGKARSQLARVVQLFLDHGAFEHTIIVSAPSSAPPGQQYLAPYVACSIGEYFMHRGKHVFIGFDDFTKHAWCYREISLLMGRPPGRDSYPGDIFYLHSKMIERACHYDDAHGSGSMTFLPLVEIQEGDLTAYIPSNLVSMTDGQILLDAAMFGQGQKPALDLGLSVSRVGTKVQWPIIKDLAAPMRLEFLQIKELQKTSKLRSGPQSEELQLKLKSGEILTALMCQDKNKPVPLEALTLMLYGFREKIIFDLTPEQLSKFQDEIYDYALERNPDFLKQLRAEPKLNETTEEGLRDILESYIREHCPVVEQVEEEEEESDDMVANIGRDVLDEAALKGLEKKKK